jgi:alanine dehydrogenase
MERGVNVYDGRVTYKAVADAFGLDFTPLSNLLPVGAVAGRN